MFFLPLDFMRTRHFPISIELMQFFYQFDGHQRLMSASLTSINDKSNRVWLNRLRLLTFSYKQLICCVVTVVCHLLVRMMMGELLRSLSILRATSHFARKSLYFAANEFRCLCVLCERVPEVLRKRTPIITIVLLICYRLSQLLMRHDDRRGV